MTDGICAPTAQKYDALHTQAALWRHLWRVGQETALLVIELLTDRAEAAEARVKELEAGLNGAACPLPRADSDRLAALERELADREWRLSRQAVSLASYQKETQWLREEIERLSNPEVKVTLTYRQPTNGYGLTAQETTLTRDEITVDDDGPCGCPVCAAAREADAGLDALDEQLFQA